MTKTGFKPKCTAFHYYCAKQFEKHLKKKSKGDVVNHTTFVRWLYGIND